MPTERRLAAIMFTDIVGYTALMARDEDAARAARDRHETVVRPLVEEKGAGPRAIAQFSGNPMRRSRSWKRGSERSGSRLGSAFMRFMCGSRSR